LRSSFILVWGNMKRRPHDLHCPVKTSHPCVFVRFSSSKHVWDISKSLDLWRRVASKLELHWAWFWSLQPCSCIIAEWPDPYVAGAWTTTLKGSLTESNVGFRLVRSKLSRYCNLNSESKLADKINSRANRVMSD
jgi:hypothetical protein